MNQKILVTGSTGLVGSRFVQLFPQPHNLLTPDEHQMDITDKDSVAKYFAKNSPSAIIHLAAFTDVNAAEVERGNTSGKCWIINVNGTANLSQVAKQYNTHFIYISTDMVFPGTREFPGPYAENISPKSDLNRLTWYGYSKLSAEKELPDPAALVRIIYPVRAKFKDKLDYLRKPLKLYDEGKLYPFFSDQQVSISFIDEVSTGLQKIITEHLTGIFHFSASDISTPFDLISYLLKQARGVSGVVKSSSLDEFLKTVDKPYRYPKYGGLDSRATAAKLKIRFKTCFEIVDALVGQGITV